MNNKIFKYALYAIVAVVAVIVLFRHPAGIGVIGFGILVSENWADALDPIVREKFFLGMSRRVGLRARLFNVNPSARAYEQVSGIGAIGIDAWNQWENSGKVGQADFDQGYKTTFTHREYPLEVQIKSKLLKDNMWNEVFDIPARVGDSAQQKMEVDAASVFNNAFSASFLGADGVALCSDSHPQSPQKTGTTQDNNGTLTLTKANVRTVREAMMAFTDDNGQKMAVTPTLLLVPPTLEDDAIEITKSINDPTSANNTVNAQYNRFEVLPWHYLTDTNAWFMIDPILMKQALEWYDREAISINPKVEDKTLVATWIALMRYSYGFADWRWLFGNNPS